MRENRRLFLGDLPLAEDLPWDGAEAGSWVAVCGHCGKAWAKLDSGNHSFIPLRLPCWYHGDRYRVGGSLLAPFFWWESTTESTLPRLLLAHPKWLSHEFAMHLNWIENYG